MTPEEWQLWKRLNACPQFKEAMGEWRGVDRGYCTTHNIYYHFDYFGDEPCCDNEGLRLPLTIDDSSEEAHKRSLVGMLDDKKSYTLTWHTKYALQIYDDRVLGKIIAGDTFTIAILKALLAQWEG